MANRQMNAAPVGWTGAALSSGFPPRLPPARAHARCQRRGEAWQASLWLQAPIPFPARRADDAVLQTLSSAMFFRVPSAHSQCMDAELLPRRLHHLHHLHHLRHPTPHTPHNSTPAPAHIGPRARSAQALRNDSQGSGNRSQGRGNDSEGRGNRSQGCGNDSQGRGNRSRIRCPCCVRTTHRGADKARRRGARDGERLLGATCRRRTTTDRKAPPPANSLRPHPPPPARRPPSKRPQPSGAWREHSGVSLLSREAALAHSPG